MIIDELVNTEIKQCNKCSKVKSISEFYKIDKCKNKYRSICKECSNASRRKGIQQANKERFELGLKKCARCHEVKLLTEFHKSRYTRHGVISTCKECRRYEKHPRKNKGVHQEIKNLFELGLRKCTKCLEIKPISEYHKHKSKYYGINNSCAKCSNEPRNKGIYKAIQDLRDANLKKCTKCFEIKSLTEFHNNKKSKDRVFQYCKECRISPETKNKVIEKQILDKLGLKLCAACSNIKFKTDFYRFSYNSDGLHSFCKFCIKIRSYNRQYVTDYSDINQYEPNVYYIFDDETINAETLNQLRFVKQSNRCAYCFILLDDIKGSPNHAWLDHIIPVSKQGIHSLQNVAYACRTCNISNLNKNLKDWLWS